MKRYYLSTLIGTGGMTDPIRTPIYDSLAPGDLHRTWAPANPQAGQTCLVLVNAVSHARFLADTQNDALPDFPFDARLSALHGPALQAMNSAVQRRNMIADWTNSSGFREVVRSIGVQIEPGFDENSFDLIEG